MQASHTKPPTELLNGFQAFADAGSDFIREVVANSTHHNVPRGMMTSLQGAQCTHFPIVLEGTARVFTVGENGSEITLYRLEPGDGCVLAAASILSALPLPAFAIAETDGEVLMIPAANFIAWFDGRDFWRRFVFSLIAHNLANVIAVTNATAFQRLDARVANLLLTSDGDPVRTTHQAIALELGSSREVVSRVLKSFEIEELVDLGRGAIRIVDREGLVAKAKLE